MNNEGFSGKPQNSPSGKSEDIPPALRDTPDVAPKVRVRPRFLIIGGVAVFVLLAIISGFLFFVTTPKKTVTQDPSPTSSASATSLSQSGNDVNPENKNADTLLGHFSYSEAPESELVTISADGRIRMRKAAAQKYQAMAEAARSQGVILVPISAFRSVKDQQQLFFGVKSQRNQSAAERAAVSAPPRYSEHHTGYAVDIGDGAVPATNVNPNFDKTKAFQWLQANAARFSFEISFPNDNPQGVSYEPWHWRYVGDQDSLETFYKARNFKPAKVAQ
ncbi:MAG: D-alanyl-D-alanine carboxypeptidase family protein [Stigonema ocellatum SAG 48.90 = DSM 106950]|nr:D-alanyl-D-alanine carboxypeptidase family protein [Stigonema ocellatum SAG 48.90 = DSM 106950]